ncbi:MAG: response regulator [Planctomycetes bacterium]|nr:response regulator [Planctomycetota bacterium]
MKSLKVLVVDDSGAVRRFLRSVFESIESLEVEIDEANQGLEAFMKTKYAMEAGNGYDLITLDINMPDFDGRSFMEQLSKLPMEEDELPKVIAVSAISETKTKRDMLSLGCCAYQVKPFNEADFIQLIHQELELS